MLTRDDIQNIEQRYFPNPHIEALCSDWRALQVQLSHTIADRDSEQRWACDYSSQVEKLTHELEAARAELNQRINLMYVSNLQMQVKELYKMLKTIMSWHFVQSYRWAEDDEYSRTLIKAEELIAKVVTHV